MEEPSVPGDVRAEQRARGRASFDRFGRRTFETFAALVSYTVVNSLYYFVIARTLGAHGTGVVSVATMLSTVLALAVFGVLNLANTYFGARDAGVRGALLANTLVFAAVVGALVPTVVLLTLHSIGVSFGAEWFELAIVFCAVPFGAAYRLILALVLASGRSLAFNLVSALPPVLLLAFVAVAFTAFEPAVFPALVVFALTQLATFAAALGVARIRPAWPSRALLRDSFRYGFRAYLGSLVQMFNYRIDLFLVSSLRGPTAAGIYGVAAVLAELLAKIPSAAGTILFPRVAADEGAPVSFTLRVARAVLVVSVVAAVALVLASAWVVLPLLGEEFERALTPLVLLLPGVVALALLNVLASDLAGRGSPEVLTYAALFGLVPTLTLNPILIPTYGPAGAAVASTVSYGMSALFVGVVYARRFGVGPRDLLIVRRGDLRVPGRRTSAPPSADGTAVSREGR